MNAKHHINLLQSELLPKKEPVTLKNVALMWGVTFILMLSLGGYVQYHNQALQQQSKQLSGTNQALKKQVSALEIKIANHKADKKLVTRLATLKLVIANKKALHKQLIDDQESYVSGFARAMGDLAAIHSRDVSLESIVINQNEITFTGTAKTPEAVPLWLARFDKSSVLTDKNFNHFSLSENENSTTDFVVSTASEGAEK